MRRVLLPLLFLALPLGLIHAFNVPGNQVDFAGDTNVAIVLVEFHDSGAPPNTAPNFDQDDRDLLTSWMFAAAPGPSVAHLYDEMSFGADRLLGQGIFRTVTIAKDGYAGAPCAPGGWYSAALAEANHDGALSPGGDFDLVVFLYSAGNDCDGPLKGVNGIAHRPIAQNALPAVSVFNWRTPQSIAHEIGHLKGWEHAELAGYFGNDFFDGYGDHSCVMGDNYVYADHPEYSEYDPVPNDNPIKLQMRHASAPLKIRAGYLDANDLFETPDGPGTQTVLLAPTELERASFPVPPGGAPVYHAAIVELTGDDRTYVVSYRHRSIGDYDDVALNPQLDHLLGRVQVHSFGPGSGINIVRDASLVTGEDFSDGKFTVTALTDGLNEEDHVEVEIVVHDLYSPDVVIDAIPAVQNPDGLDSAPIAVTVENTGPAGSATSTFELSFATEAPEIVGATLVPSTLTIAPGQSATADLTLHFTSPLPNGEYAFEITAADLAGPRDVGTASAIYHNDLTGPVMRDFEGDHRGDRIELGWRFEPFVDYDLEKYDATLGQFETLLTGVSQSAFTDSDGIVPGSTHTYRLRGTDAVGNVGDWATLVVTDPCAQGVAITAVDPPDFQVTEDLSGFGTVASHVVTIRNLNPASCGTQSFTVQVPDTLPTGYSASSSSIGVAGDSSASTTIFLSYFDQSAPPGPLDNLVIVFDVRVTGPFGVSDVFEDVRFTYDSEGPNAPPTLDGSQNPVSVSLSWGAAIDATTGVTSYRIVRNGVYRATVGGLSFTDASAPSARPLTYTVRGIDEVGNLGAPRSLTFTTAPGCAKCPIPNQQ